MSFGKVLLLSSAVTLGANSMNEEAQVTSHQVDENRSLIELQGKIPANYERLLYEVDESRENISSNYNVDESLEKLKDVASKGNKDAMFVLSQVYQEGQVVNKDPKLASLYYKKAIYSGWSEADIERLQSSEQSVNEASEALDKVIVQMPYVIANRVKSLAKHGTSSILEEDPELVENEAVFVSSVGIFLRAIGDYIVSDMTKSRKDK